MGLSALPPPVLVAAPATQSYPTAPLPVPPVPPPAPPVYYSSAPPAPPSPGSVVRPAESPATWFRDKDYPKADRKAGHSGRVRVSLTIDRKGRVTACAVSNSSGYATLDARTCELAIKRGRFTVNGYVPRGVKTFSYALTVNWRAEDE